MRQSAYPPETNMASAVATNAISSEAASTMRPMNTALRVTAWLIVFDELLRTLMREWVTYGAAHAEEACQPPVSPDEMTAADWSDYVERASECEDTGWYDLIKTGELMYDRIQHMLERALAYNASVYDRS